MKYDPPAEAKRPVLRSAEVLLVVATLLVVALLLGVLASQVIS